LISGKPWLTLKANLIAKKTRIRSFYWSNFKCIKTTQLIFCSSFLWPSIENVKKGCYLILDFCLWINFISLLVQRSNEPMNGAKDAFQFYRKKLCLTSPVLTQNWKLCLTFFNAAHGRFKCEPQSCFLNICLKKKIGDSKKWFWACYKKFSSQPHVPKR